MKKGRLIPLLMILTICFGCQGEKMLSVPDELQGVWKASGPEYADKSFEFRHDTLIFGVGEGKFDSYAIKYLKKKRDRDGKSTVYTIYYEDEAGEEYTLSMYYYPQDNGVIKVQYQEHIVWEREQGK